VCVRVYVCVCVFVHVFMCCVNVYTIANIARLQNNKAYKRVRQRLRDEVCVVCMRPFSFSPLCVRTRGFEVIFIQLVKSDSKVSMSEKKKVPYMTQPLSKYEYGLKCVMAHGFGGC
jgi:hypothetical protein